MKHAFLSILNFYIEGFRSMTLGRTLWIIILIKLFVMFLILRPFFFPKYLNSAHVGADKGGFVSTRLIEQASGDLHGAENISTNTIP